MTTQTNPILIYDDSLMRQENIGANGLTEKQVRSFYTSNASVYERTSKAITDKQYDFMDLAYNENLIKQCKQTWDPFTPWVKHIVFIGIGGASQVPKIIHDAFGKYKKGVPSVEFVGDFTDPAEYQRLQTKVIGYENETAIIIVSKTGTTVEPSVWYLLFREHFEKVLGNEWRDHFLFITGQDGLFINEVRSQDLHYMETSAVGDRFAVLSSIGLLPATIFGLDSYSLLKGSRDFFEFTSHTSQEKNIAWNIALYQLAYQSLFGVNMFTPFVYLARLNEFSMWLRQLWAESLGKEKRGILLFPAMGPRDQHSVLQMFNDGPWLNTFLFISQKKPQSDINIENRSSGTFDHLDNSSLGNITDFSCRNTQLTLKNYQRPSAHLQISRFDEETMGALIAMFELVVVYMGELFGITNVFNQPGVSESRDFIDARMKRPGSEKAQRTLEQMEKRIIASRQTYP
ncbi:MAG: hypothetical protein WC489_05840 [Patescibacteria group bacterium]